MGPTLIQIFTTLLNTHTSTGPLYLFYQSKENTETMYWRQGISLFGGGLFISMAVLNIVPEK